MIWNIVRFTAAFAFAVTAQTATGPTAPPTLKTSHLSKARLVIPSTEHYGLPLPGGTSYQIRSIINFKHPLHFGGYLWDGSASAQGSSLIWIDLSAQTLSIFSGGHEIGSTVVLFGADNKETPVGAYPILAKEVHHRSTLYDAEMPYMLRLTGDGVAIHASDVREGRATHGCIGVPLSFAKRLFGAVSRGDLVVVTRGTHLTNRRVT